MTTRFSLGFCFISYFVGILNTALRNLLPPNVKLDLARMIHSIFDLEVSIRLLICRPRIFVGLSSFSSWTLFICKYLDVKSVVSHGSLSLEYDRQILKTYLPLKVAMAEIAPIWCIDRERREFKLADKVHVLSKLSAETIGKYSGRPIDTFVITRPPVSPIFSQFSGVQLFRARRQAFRNQISIIGSICGRKGFFRIIDSAVDLPSVRFELRGSLAPSILDYITECPPNMVLLSPIAQKDMPTYLKEQHIVASFSYSDGYGLSILEAMRFGIPVIVTESAGISEIIDDGQNGFLMPENSSDLKNIIDRLHNTKYRRYVSKNAYKTAQRLADNNTWSSLIKYLDINEKNS